MNTDVIDSVGKDVTASLDVGHVVVDSEQPSHKQDRAVVVNTPPIRADEWQVYDRTVADDNPSYDPSENVVVIVYEDELQEQYPEFNGGGGAIQIRQLEMNDVSYYAFPRSRVSIIGSRTPPVIKLCDIHPSPYHSRSFLYRENQAFIQSIRETGFLDPRPIVVPSENGYELVNGHKRVWAGCVAGIETTQCHVAYFTPERKIQKWAKWHLHDYTEPQQRHALEEIQRDVSTSVRDVLLDETLAAIEVDVK